MIIFDGVVSRCMYSSTTYIVYTRCKVCMMYIRDVGVGQ